MLVVCTIAYMIVNKNVGIQTMKNPGKALCFAAVVLGKVAVQVQVLCIPAETISLRPVLVYP